MRSKLSREVIGRNTGCCSSLEPGTERFRGLEGPASYRRVLDEDLWAGALLLSCLQVSAARFLIYKIRGRHSHLECRWSYCFH